MKEGKHPGLTSEQKKYFNKDRLECHLCGESYEQLGWHLQVKHKVSLSEYRKRYNLPKHVPLLGLGARNKVLSRKLRPFRTNEELDRYFDNELIECLECGEIVDNLGPHIRSIHKMTAAEYREKWQIPSIRGLAGTRYRQERRATMRKNIDSGKISTSEEHLSKARAKIDYSNRRSMTQASRDAALKNNPFGVDYKVPVQRHEVTGRNMDRKKEYDRAYHALKEHGDSTLMEAYKAAYGERFSKKREDKK